MSAADGPRPPRGAGSRRPWFLAATAAATAVTVVFATVGDGVEVPGATGLRALVVDVGHTAVWALLAGAFAIAAARGRWTPPSNRLALAAAVVYAVFLVAVFVWR
ncbi:hypothetical protein [Microbacterium sp. PA5]|uniref:hypothetical protein n=1 Tax=Microbacterium sp. PA5 TaxID=3416654 RepID=UPI003CFB9633